MSKKEILTHSKVHYLKAIHDLFENEKRSKAVDIANFLDISKASVTLAIKRLKQNNLVDEDKDRNLFLTKEGHDCVHMALANKSLLYYFLKEVLKVNEKVAHIDSCKLEHLVSEETQSKLFKFLKTSNLIQDFETLKQFKAAQNNN